MVKRLNTIEYGDQVRAGYNETDSIKTTGDIEITSPGIFIGNGSGLTNLPVTLSDVVNRGNTTSNLVQFSNTLTSLTASGNVSVTGNVTASIFYGDGGALSNITVGGGGSQTLQQVSDLGNVTSNCIQFTNTDVSAAVQGRLEFQNSNIFIRSNLYSSGKIMIGYHSDNAQDNQGEASVGIGRFAGNVTQGDRAVAIGMSAGEFSQEYGSVAIGYAGQGYQGSYGISIGYDTAQTKQGDYGICMYRV